MNAPRRLKLACMDLVKQGADKITVRSLCEQADVSRQTFYRHYIDKYDLYEDLLMDLVFHPLYDTALSLKERYLRHLTLIKQYSEFIHQILDTCDVNVFMTGCRKLHKTAIMDMVTGHGARPIDDETVFAIDYEICATSAVMHEWVMGDMTADPEALCDQILSRMPSVIKESGDKS